MLSSLRTWALFDFNWTIPKKPKRWLGRQILEVVSTEFRDRSVDYYRHALETGVTTVNGKVATPTYVLKANDRIE